jgi:uncharacterized protein with PIN domain
MKEKIEMFDEDQSTTTVDGRIRLVKARTWCPYCGHTFKDIFSNKLTEDVELTCPRCRQEFWAISSLLKTNRVGVAYDSELDEFLEVHL